MPPKIYKKLLKIIYENYHISWHFMKKMKKRQKGIGTIDNLM